MDAKTSLTLAIALAMGAGSTAARSPAQPGLPSGSGESVAYGETSSAGGYEYVRLFGSESDIGRLDVLYVAGGFAGDDFTREYAIAAPSGLLAAIDTSTAATTPIGSTGLGGTLSGPR
jgi:hypothetical protein